VPHLLSLLPSDRIWCSATSGWPRWGGLEFVEKLRNHADETLRHIPVIMLTMEARQSTILEAARFQVDGYLIKPVSVKKLEERMRRLF
jgi:two-component system, chemotaxis family, chemotaxis protein CheY